MGRSTSHARLPLGLAAVIAAVTGAGRAAAIGSAESGDVSIDATGSVRLTAAYLHFPELPPALAVADDALAAGVARLVLTGKLGAALDYETNLYAELSRSSAASLGGAFATAGSFDSPYRTAALQWDYWRQGAVGGKLGVDRIKLTLAADPLTLSVGRFPVNHAVTGIFTPNDFFAPFGATAIDTLYKPGVDAMRLGWAVDALSSVEVVRVLGYRSDGVPSWGHSALLARASTVLAGFEGALLGGKVAERWIAGGSLQGEAGPLMLRAEGHAGFNDVDGDGQLEAEGPNGVARDRVQARLAAGVESSFAWHNVTIGAEYAFFSDGASAPAQYVSRLWQLFPDDLGFLGRHYAAVRLAGEIVPIVTVSLSALLDAADGSGLAMTSLCYDAADEAVLSGGLLLPWGRKPASAPSGAPSLASELGHWPVAAFLETRIHF